MPLKLQVCTWISGEWKTIHTHSQSGVSVLAGTEISNRKRILAHPAVFLTSLGSQNLYREFLSVPSHLHHESGSVSIVFLRVNNITVFLAGSMTFHKWTVLLLTYVGILLMKLWENPTKTVVLDRIPTRIA